MKKRNCVYYSEEYIGNPGVTPICGKKSKFDFDCTGCKDFVSREDKVIVIRCKDCKHFFDNGSDNVAIYECELLHEKMRDDFFCADGVRRDDDDR